MKNLAFMFAIALFFVALPAMAEDAPDEVWLAVVIAGSDAFKGPSEYYGSALKVDYDAVVSGSAKGFLTLRKSFYISKDKQIIRFQDIATYGYSGQISFRADTIIRIKQLRKSFIDSNARIIEAPNKSEADLAKEKAPPDEVKIDLKVKDKDF